MSRGARVPLFAGLMVVVEAFFFLEAELVDMLKLGEGCK